nr:MAG TPA: hypothetical protein [Caudoviricetes sp.]
MQLRQLLIYDFPLLSVIYLGRVNHSAYFC